MNITLLIHLYFFIAQLTTKSKVFARFTQGVFTFNRMSGNCLHFANIIYNASSFGDGLWKNSKSNETRIFAQRCPGRRIFFIDLELKQALIYAKNFPSWNTTDFTYYLSYIIAKRNFVLFLFFKASITHLWINFTTLESSHSLHFEKNVLLYRKNHQYPRNLLQNSFVRNLIVSENKASIYSTFPKKEKRKQKQNKTKQKKIYFHD